MLHKKQHTLAKAISLNGFGIHSAKFCTVDLTPMPADKGIVFRKDEIIKKYSPENVQADARGTNIVFAENNIFYTIEHLVSALAGMGIDNVLIDVDGPELPIKDGSALFYAEKIKEAGLQEQNAEKKYLKTNKEIIIKEMEKFVFIKPAATFKVNFVIDYQDEIVKTDIFSFDISKDDYLKEIAPARTYGFTSEIEYLVENNFAKGFTGENALVVDEQGYSLDLRFPDELARHKVLDFIGDIYAGGILPQAEFFVFKSGHKFNQKIACSLAKFL